MGERGLTEEEATAERAMMRLEAEADAWLVEAPEIGGAIRSMAGLVRGPFKDRVAAQIDNIVRQTFVEAFYRGFNAHKDHAAGRAALKEDGDGKS